ncbi:MAG: complex I NDUFA9 subunit family protein [Candidatus Schekmanbacteria bacterium]|nr:complex I NDUFA9 subunit family protein [Candidatus Schekmanbacteria bacterium]
MILIIGGTGFVGKHLVERLRDTGKKIRCLVRSDKADYLSASGIETVKGDILDPASLDKAMIGCDAVIHLAGIWRADMKTYKAVHIQGTANAVNAARKAGVKRFIYISAMGVSLGIRTGFYLTKGESENAVKKSGLDYTIFRPAVIIGKGDEFTTALVAMIKQAPVIPVIGSGQVKLQPLWVNDLVDCLIKALDRPQTIGQTYDIAGPDVLTYNQILDELMQVLELPRRKVFLPMFMVSPAICMAEIFIRNLPITHDQLKIMSVDNVRDISKTVKDFDLKQTGFKTGIKNYLG